MARSPAPHAREHTGLTRDTTLSRRAIADLVGNETLVQPQPDRSVHFILKGDYAAMVQLARAKGRKGRSGGGNVVGEPNQAFVSSALAPK